jgi:DNA-binding SARP family transcriptional activator
MPHLHVKLFGQLQIFQDERELHAFDAQKARELFCYLLVHRDHAHAREALAGVLWEDSSPAQAKKNLRQALWRLQTSLAADGVLPAVVIPEGEWVRVNPDADVSLDVADLEDAFVAARGIPGRDLDSDAAAKLQNAIALYTGDLLEGWYQDWCLHERERLRHMYLAILDKLVANCDANRLYENGLVYAERMLQYDRARESTYRHLMRLQYLMGDRTGALRQYDRCVAALRDELDVPPASRTEELHNQIRADRLHGSDDSRSEEVAVTAPAETVLVEVLARLRQINAALLETETRLQREILTVERALHLERLG